VTLHWVAARWKFPVWATARNACICSIRIGLKVLSFSHSNRCISKIKL
jgi:hypothetical protein